MHKNITSFNLLQFTLDTILCSKLINLAAQRAVEWKVALLENIAMVYLQSDFMDT